MGVDTGWRGVQHTGVATAVVKGGCEISHFLFGLHKLMGAGGQGRVGLEESGGSMGSHSVERSELRLPSVGAMRTGSMGSIGLEGSSPPQPDFRHHSLSYDSRSTSGFRQGCQKS